MLEDIQIRNYSLHTIDGYLRYATKFAKHFGTSPDRLGAEHIRTYQLHLLQQHASKSIFIQTVCALRFLYETTLGRPWMVEYIPYPKKPCVGLEIFAYHLLSSPRRSFSTDLGGGVGIGSGLASSCLFCVQ